MVEITPRAAYAPLRGTVVVSYRVVNVAFVSSSSGSALEFHCRESNKLEISAVTLGQEQWAYVPESLPVPAEGEPK